MPHVDQPGVPASNPLLPDYLRMRLEVRLDSQARNEYDDLGWECWYGTLIACWDTYNKPNIARVLTDELSDDFPWLKDELPADGGDIELDIGGCELLGLRLGVSHPVFGDGVYVDPDALSVFDAADALSQDLADIVGALTSGADDGPFIDEILAATGTDWFYQLVILRNIGIRKKFRGQGIGGWFAARAISHLAPDDGSLVALKAAPLSRSEFLASVGADDPGTHHELTDAQSKAWDAASERIAANWRRHLGLQPLNDNPAILFGAGGENDHRTETFATWARRREVD